MAGKVSVRVTVNETVLKGLTTSPEVEAEIKRRAELVANRMRDLCPVDTGHLRSNIEIRNSNKAGSKDVGVWVVEYAAAVNNGHRTRGGTFVPAQPFIEPALDAARG